MEEPEESGAVTVATCCRNQLVESLQADSKAFPKAAIKFDKLRCERHEGGDIEQNEHRLRIDCEKVSCALLSGLMRGQISGLGSKTWYLCLRAVARRGGARAGLHVLHAPAVRAAPVHGGRTHHGAALGQDGHQGAGAGAVQAGA